MVAFASLAMFACLQEPLDLTLEREKGLLGEYRFELADSDPESGLKIEAEYKVEYKGFGKVHFEPTSFEMLVAGAANNSQPFTSAEMETDEYGLPIKPDIAGMQLIFVIHQFAGYVPNRKVGVDERYAIEDTNDESSFKGEGRYLGLEEVQGRKLGRTKLTGVYIAYPNMPKIEVDLDTWYDPAVRRVTRARGKLYSVESRKGKEKKNLIEVSIEPISRQ